MHIELVDRLRCLRDHEDVWLIASIERMDRRHIEEGTLGCSVCGAEYPIHDGEALLDASTHAPGDDGDATPLSADDALRAAALLDLAEPGGCIVLAGAWAAYAPLLLDVAQAHYLLLDPTEHVPLAEEISVVRAGGRVPLAPVSMRAIALDARSSSPEAVASAARALRPGGRLILPASAGAPPGVADLARDAQHWVGEKRSEVVHLKLRR